MKIVASLFITGRHEGIGALLSSFDDEELPIDIIPYNGGIYCNTGIGPFPTYDQLMEEITKVVSQAKINADRIRKFKNIPKKIEFEV